MPSKPVVPGTGWLTGCQAEVKQVTFRLVLGPQMISSVSHCWLALPVVWQWIRLSALWTPPPPLNTRRQWRVKTWAYLALSPWGEFLCAFCAIPAVATGAQTSSSKISIPYSRRSIPFASCQLWCTWAATKNAPNTTTSYSVPLVLAAWPCHPPAW